MLRLENKQLRAEELARRRESWCINLAQVLYAMFAVFMVGSLLGYYVARAEQARGSPASSSWKPKPWNNSGLVEDLKDAAYELGKVDKPVAAGLYRHVLLLEKLTDPAYDDPENLTRSVFAKNAQCDLGRAMLLFGKHMRAAGEVWPHGFVHVFQSWLGRLANMRQHAPMLKLAEIAYTWTESCAAVRDFMEEEQKFIDHFCNATAATGLSNGLFWKSHHALAETWVLRDDTHRDSWAFP
jgi:hypothetical protein